MRQVTDQLWIGDIADAQQKSMREYDIDTVITVCQDNVSDNIGVEYHHFNMSDGASDYGGDSSYELFEKAADMLLAALWRGDTVLIHCHVGMSRSVSVATAVLALYEDISFEAAYNRCRMSRAHSHRPEQLLLDHARRYIDDTDSV